METIQWKEIEQTLQMIKLKFEILNKKDISQYDKPLNEVWKDYSNQDFDKIRENVVNISKGVQNDPGTSRDHIDKLKRENEGLKKKYVENCEKIRDKLDLMQDTMGLINIYIENEEKRL